MYFVLMQCIMCIAAYSCQYLLQRFIYFTSGNILCIHPSSLSWNIEHIYWCLWIGWVFVYQPEGEGKILTATAPSSASDWPPAPTSSSFTALHWPDWQGTASRRRESRPEAMPQLLEGPASYSPPAWKPWRRRRRPEQAWIEPRAQSWRGRRERDPLGGLYPSQRLASKL